MMVRWCLVPRLLFVRRGMVPNPVPLNMPGGLPVQHCRRACGGAQAHSAGTNILRSPRPLRLTVIPCLAVLHLSTRDGV